VIEGDWAVLGGEGEAPLAGAGGEVAAEGLAFVGEEPEDAFVAQGVGGGAAEAGGWVELGLLAGVG